jgi:hypothetical protein
MLVVGVGVALVVGFGLMALMFYSSREGYDDAAHEGDRNPEEGPPPSGSWHERKR